MHDCNCYAELESLNEKALSLDCWPRLENTPFVFFRLTMTYIWGHYLSEKIAINGKQSVGKEFYRHSTCHEHLPGVQQSRKIFTNRLLIYWQMGADNFIVFSDRYCISVDGDLHHVVLPVASMSTL